MKQNPSSLKFLASLGIILIIFQDGFENGFTPWSGQSASSGNTLTTVTDSHSGSYAMKSVIKDCTYAYVYKTFASSQQVNLRIWVKVSARPPWAGIELAMIATNNWGTDGHYVSVTYNAGGKGFALETHGADSPAWTVQYTNEAISLNTWYCLELEASSGSSATQKLYVNGVLKLSKTRNTGSKPYPNRIRTGQHSQAWNGVMTVIIDDVVVSSSYIGTGASPPTPSPPTWSNLGHNATDVGAVCKMYTKWNSPNGLKGYIFSWNGTGSWTNSTWTAWSGSPMTAWSNVTKTLPLTEEVAVGYCFYANETNGGWNRTSIGSLVTTKPPSYESTILTLNFDPQPSSQLPPYRYRVYGSLTLASNATGVSGARLRFFIGYNPDYAYLTTVVTRSDGSYEFYWSTVATGEYSIKGVYQSDRALVLGTSVEKTATW